MTVGCECFSPASDPFVGDEGDGDRQYVLLHYFLFPPTQMMQMLTTSDTFIPVSVSALTLCLFLSCSQPSDPWRFSSLFSLFCPPSFFLFHPHLMILLLFMKKTAPSSFWFLYYCFSRKTESSTKSHTLLLTSL